MKAHLERVEKGSLQGWLMGKLKGVVCGDDPIKYPKDFKEKIRLDISMGRYASKSKYI